MSWFSDSSPDRDHQLSEICGIPIEWGIFGVRGLTFKTKSDVTISIPEYELMINPNAVVPRCKWCSQPLKFLTPALNHYFEKHEGELGYLILKYSLQ